MERIATLQQLLESLPKEEKTEEVLTQLPIRYERLVKMLKEYGEDAKEPEIVLYPFDKCGCQYIRRKYKDP